MRLLRPGVAPLIPIGCVLAGLIGPILFVIEAGSMFQLLLIPVIGPAWIVVGPLFIAMAVIPDFTGRSLQQILVLVLGLSLSTILMLIYGVAFAGRLTRGQSVHRYLLGWAGGIAVGTIVMASIHWHHLTRIVIS